MNKSTNKNKCNDYLEDIRNLPVLTAEQERHLKTIMWLIGGPIATGRTYLLAFAFIKTALQQSGKRIYIWDHRPNYVTVEILQRQIRSLIKGIPQQNNFTFGPDWIMYC